MKTGANFTIFEKGAGKVNKGAGEICNLKLLAGREGKEKRSSNLKTKRKAKLPPSFFRLNL